MNVSSAQTPNCVWFSPTGAVGIPEVWVLRVGWDVPWGSSSSREFCRAEPILGTGGADPIPTAEGLGRGWRRTAGTPSPRVIPKHIPQAQLELPSPCAHPRGVGSAGDSNPRDLHPLPTHIPLRGDIAANPHESSLIPKHLGSFCGRREKEKPKQTLEEAELNIPFKIS